VLPEEILRSDSHILEKVVFAGVGICVVEECIVERFGRSLLVQGRVGVTRAASSAALAIWAAKRPELRGRSRPSLDLRSAKGGPLSPRNPLKMQ